MVRIYGCSDDLVEIEGSNYAEDEIGCFDGEVLLTFDDGTIARIGYPKHRAGIWYINIEHEGSAAQTLTICNDEDADPYSDVLEIDAEIVSHEIVKL